MENISPESPVSGHPEPFILYHLACDTTFEDIFSALKSLLPFEKRLEAGHPIEQPKLLTESRVVFIKTKEVQKHLLARKELAVRGQLATVLPYRGESTEKEIDSDLASRIVYVAGIPTMAQRGLLLSTLQAAANVKEFFVPKNNGRNNRHFGFAICETLEDKENLIKLRKLKGDYFRLLLSNFDFEKYKENARKKKRKLLTGGEKNGGPLPHHMAPKHVVVKQLFKGKATYLAYQNPELNLNIESSQKDAFTLRKASLGVEKPKAFDKIRSLSFEIENKNKRRKGSSSKGNYKFNTIKYETENPPLQKHSRDCSSDYLIE